MAIAQRGTSTNNGAGVLSGVAVSLNKPTGVVSGDLLIACITEDDRTTTGLTPPSGWTTLDSASIASTHNLFGAVYYKVAGGAEPGSYSWGNAANFTDANLIAYSGVDNTTPFDVTGSHASGSANLTIPSITTVTNGAQLLIAGGNWSGTTPTATAGFTKETTQTDGNAIFDKSQTTAGTTGSVAFNAGATQQVGFLLALRPAGGGGSTVNGSANEIANSVITDAPVVLVTPATEQGNSAIGEAAIILAPALEQSNAVLSEPSAQIVTGGAIQAGSALAITAIILAPATEQANTALSEPSAIILAPAILQANSALVATGSSTGQTSVIANSALAVAAIILRAPATLQANTALVEAAARVSVATLFAVQANAILAATGGPLAPYTIGLCVTATTPAQGTAQLGDLRVNTATLATLAAGNVAVDDTASVAGLAVAGIGTATLADI